MAILYHVTPYATWLKHIRREGFVPRTEKRGKFADSNEPRIYFFEDENTAEDGLDNWLVDKFPRVRWFAILEVDVPDSWLTDDPEVSGSFYVTTPIPPQAVRRVRKIDAGDSD